MSATPRLLDDRYRLLSVVARGGMGQVWEGRDELLARTVAIKEVHFPADVPEEERSILGERTMREARLTARLTHPGIVTIYDVICVDDNPYIVMELVRAPSLAQRIDEHGPLPPSEVASIGLQLLDALAVAHRQGIVHRDVKPSNVLLADNRVVLTDFGIATSESDATLTSTGLLIGSPTYMSPERLRGEGIGPPADMWSLGATLYAALEAEPPFRATTTMGTITAVLVDDPRPPHVAGPMREALLGMLDKDVETRLTGPAAAALLRRSIEEPVGSLASVSSGTTSTEGGGSHPAPVMAPVVTWDYPARTEEPGPAAPLPQGWSIVSPSGAHPAAPQSVDAGAVPPADDAVDGWGEDDPDSAPRRWPGVLAGLAGLVAVAVLALIAWTQFGGTDETSGSGNSAGSGQTGGSGQQGSGQQGSDQQGSGQQGSGQHAQHGGQNAGGSSGPGNGPKHTPATGGATSPTQSDVSTSPAPVTTPGSGAAVPAGYQLVRDPLEFEVAVPDGWERRQVDATRVDFVNPDNPAMYLRVDQRETAGPSALGAWEEYEPTLAARLPGYQRIRLESVDYRNWEAADLEWTWQSENGGTMHVLDRGFITDPRGFALLMSGPDDTWESQSLPVFEVAAQTFSPGS